MFDSQYQVDDFILSPLRGSIVGLLGANAMLAICAGLQPISGLSPERVLTQIGIAFLPVLHFVNIPLDSPLPVGLGVHFVLGALGGTLYAVSQMRVPLRQMLATGFFYGIMLWVLGNFAGWLLDRSLQEIVRSWPWFISCLLYGLLLSVITVWVGNRKSTFPDVLD